MKGQTMKHSLVRYSLLSAALLVTAVPALATLYPENGEALEIAQADGPNRGGPPAFRGPRAHEADKPGPDRDGRHLEHRGERDGPGGSALELAGKLAAAEIYVGITADQENAWLAYTSALIAFFDRPEPAGGRPGIDHIPGKGERPAPPPSDQEAEPAGQPQRPLFVEMLADRAIDRGEKGRTLKQAAQTLRDVLSEDQLKRLAMAEQSFAPARGPRGPGQPPRDSAGGHERGNRAEPTGELPPPPPPPAPADE